MNEQKSDVNKAKLLQGPVGKTLVSLAIPLALGSVVIILFTVINAFYIGRLGTEPLAAMGFIYPITYIVMNIAMGLNIGIASTIARAIGEGHQLRARRLTTDGLGLAFLIVTFRFPHRTNKPEYHLLPDGSERGDTGTHLRLYGPLVSMCGVARGANGRQRCDSRHRGYENARDDYDHRWDSEYHVRSTSDFRHRSVSAIGVAGCGVGSGDFLGGSIDYDIVDFEET